MTKEANRLCSKYHKSVAELCTHSAVEAQTEKSTSNKTLVQVLCELKHEMGEGGNITANLYRRIDSDAVSS